MLDQPSNLLTHKYEDKETLIILLIFLCYGTHRSLCTSNKWECVCVRACVCEESERVRTQGFFCLKMTIVSWFSVISKLCFKINLVVYSLLDRVDIYLFYFLYFIPSILCKLVAIVINDLKRWRKIIEWCSLSLDKSKLWQLVKKINVGLS